MYRSVRPELELTLISTFPSNGIPVHPSQQLVETGVNETIVVETCAEEAGPVGTEVTTENVKAASNKHENRILVGTLLEAALIRISGH